VSLRGVGPVSFPSLLLRRSAAIAGLVLLLAVPAEVPARPAPDSFADLADKLLPSVVNISTTQTVTSDKLGERSSPGRPRLPPGSPLDEFFKEFLDRNGQRGDKAEPKSRKATSLGSGFVVDAAGYIVTNNHVIEGADEINVILHDDTRLKAEVLGRDNKTDVAVLKIKTDKKLVPASLSINCNTLAASSGGNASSSRNAVTSWAQTKKGMRMKLRPLARSCTIVTMKFTEPSSDEVIRNTMPSSQIVWPIVAISESGGYDVQPEFAAPAGTKKLATITRPPRKYTQ